MSLSQEEINKAIENQENYWGSLYSRIKFFKNTVITYEIIEDVFSLDNYTIYFSYKDKCINCLKDGQMHFARYWASMYLEFHLDYNWLSDYAKSRAQSLNEKKSNADADAKRNAAQKIFETKYP